MSNIFFTSDTHFGNDRVRELSRRPFKTVEEMDNTIMNNWNRIVGKEDIVYHLGDFGDYAFSNKLNGVIRLLLGNYERKELNENKISVLELSSSKYRFNQIIENPITISLKDSDLHLIHEPEVYDKDKFNLFGHIHKLQMVKKFGLNVGIDCHNFYPISIDDVLFYKNSIEKVYDNNVFMS